MKMKNNLLLVFLSLSIILFGCNQNQTNRYSVKLEYINSFEGIVIRDDEEKNSFLQLAENQLIDIKTIISQSHTKSMRSTGFSELYTFDSFLLYENNCEKEDYILHQEGKDTIDNSKENTTKKKTSVWWEDQSGKWKYTNDNGEICVNATLEKNNINERFINVIGYDSFSFLKSSYYFHLLNDGSLQVEYTYVQDEEHLITTNDTNSEDKTSISKKIIQKVFYFDTKRRLTKVTKLEERRSNNLESLEWYKELKTIYFSKTIIELKYTSNKSLNLSPYIKEKRSA